MSILGYISCYYFNRHTFIPDDEDTMKLEKVFDTTYEIGDGHCQRCWMITRICREVSY